MSQTPGPTRATSPPHPMSSITTLSTSATRQMEPASGGVSDHSPQAAQRHLSSIPRPIQLDSEARISRLHEPASTRQPRPVHRNAPPRTHTRQADALTPTQPSASPSPLARSASPLRTTGLHQHTTPQRPASWHPPVSRQGRWMMANYVHHGRGAYDHHWLSQHTCSRQHEPHPPERLNDPSRRSVRPTHPAATLVTLTTTDRRLRGHRARADRTTSRASS